MSRSSPASTAIPATFSPRRLCHLNIYVADLARSLAFYRDLCGLTVVFDEPGVGASFLSNGNSHHDLALMQTSSDNLVGRDGKVQKAATRGTEPGLNHLAWEMRTERELVAAIAAAPAHGIKVDRLLDHMISKSAYLADPDGVWHEFYSDSTREWRELYAQMEDQLISAQWEPDLEAASDESNIDDEADLIPVEHAAMRSLRTSRAAIVVSDLAESVRFYGDGLGIHSKVTSVQDGFAILGGHLGYADLLLLEQQESEPVGFHHFGLQVADEAELEAGARRLEEAGVPIVDDIDSPAGRAVVVRDPDGFSVEFFVATDTPPWNVQPNNTSQRSFLL
ncbi:dioxygenase [Mycolicibacterium murale]|uniref:Dioxygenase n=1 Tax=Mycolicibacterium murale TaxID=182220 RepID=A0A7I9WN87_9MYCO|nr:VOC family protein [Mycolicibacterium murale]MCV7180405.1 VOC family protein [Mycolicibacterium murale]GFG58726.1 dioxygenase [Mycolicibacterium murale]